MSKTLFIRIQPSQKSVERFFRCGIEFTKAWLSVTDVDTATAQRLEEEQMLEVSETRPAELDDEAQAGDSALALVPTAVVDSGAPANAPTVNEKPTDPAATLLAVTAAISQLDKSDPGLFTASNKPKTEAIAAITGWPVTAAERDAALVAEGA
jgi:hypothetical protein